MDQPPIRTRLSRALGTLQGPALGMALGLVLLLAPPAGAQRAPVEAQHGLVASANAIASAIGADILKSGGNAVDAAVATGLALAVTHPRAGNIGGGGFALLRLADGRSTSIDFRETAPAAATRDLYLDAHGDVIPGKSTLGHLAAGVPGTVAGLELLRQKYGSGRLSWAQLVEPARRLAARGFPVSPAFARSLRAAESSLGQFPASRHIFLRDGHYYVAGETFVQPDLAATLARLQRRGPREFYEGRTAQLIAAENAAHGGLITLADLAGYRPVERAPLEARYRGYQVLAMPPPSSGGIALLQMLGMLEPHDVGSLGLNSAAKVHLYAEVMRRAFRDRAVYLGDPDFTHVPVAGLLDRGYLAQLMGDFDPAHATPGDSQAPARPAGVHESDETTQYSVIDSAGNAVSITYTLNGMWGNGVTVTGAGFLLNNEMDDFAAKVGVKNMYGLLQGEPNTIAPGKRPLSSMTPTIVLKDGKPFLVTGSPGGPTIISTVLQVVTNVIDFGMGVTQAVDAGRFHHQWQPDVISYEPFATSPDTIELLRAEGHAISLRRLYPNEPEASARTWGDAESILVDPATGLRLGANDLRGADSGAVGW